MPVKKNPPIATAPKGASSARGLRESPLRMLGNPFESTADDDINVIGLLTSTPQAVPYDIIQDEIKQSTGRDLTYDAIRKLRHYNEDDKMNTALLLRKEAIRAEISIQLYMVMLEELRKEIERADPADFNKDKFNLQLLVIDKIVKILQDKVGRYEKRYRQAKAEAKDPKEIATFNVTPQEEVKATPDSQEPPEIDQDFY